MVIQYAKVGVANREGYVHVKTPAKTSGYTIDSLAPVIKQEVSYIQASGWWWDRFKGSGVV